MRRSMWTTAAVLTLISVPAAAQESGQVLWRYEIPSPVPGRYVGVGADGRLYTTSFDPGTLYALTPGGSLVWSLDLGSASSHWPITFGGDGTIYTGAIGVRAVNPDGTLRWAFDPGAWILSGPNVGPDGNIYAADDAGTGGLGFFSLTPDGDLRWSNPGSPAVTGLTSDNDEIVFGAGRLFGGIHFRRSGPWISTYSFDLDGNQLWYRYYTSQGGPSSNPRLLRDGRLVFRWGQGSLAALDQAGSDDWVEPHPDGAQVLFAPAVGPDGAIYAGDEHGVQLWSANPDGTTRWVRPVQNIYESLRSLGVSPDNRVLIATGWTYAETGWVRGYDTADGSLLWEVILPPEQGLGQVTHAVRPAFSPSGDTAYLTTWFVGDGVGHSYLYAIALSATLSVPPGPHRGETMMSVSPNPSTGQATVVLRTDRDSHASVTVHDILGREVRRLFEGRVPAGEMRLEWNLRDDREESVVSGVYFLTARTTAGRSTVRMVVGR